VEFTRTRDFLISSYVTKLYKRRKSGNKMKQGLAWRAVRNKGLLATERRHGLGCRCVMLWVKGPSNRKRESPGYIIKISRYRIRGGRENKWEQSRENRPDEAVV
jgi:hypothetical protein